MIISEIKEKDSKQRKSFPKLMKAINGHHIVLAFSAHFAGDMLSGTVISSKTSGEVGIYLTDYALSLYKDFEGEITLSNKEINETEEK